MSRDPVFGHVTYFTLQKTLNISRTVGDRDEISKTGNRKSMMAEQMHMFILPQQSHVTLFSVTWRILWYRKRWISRIRLEIETKFQTWLLGNQGSSIK